MLALVMCGGKGSRLGLHRNEKPLLRIKGRPLVDYVIDAINSAGVFRAIYAVPSQNTPKTLDYLHSAKRQIIDRILVSPGIGYSSDLYHVLKLVRPSIAFVVSSDMPLLNAEIIKRIAVLVQTPDSLSLLKHTSLSLVPCVSVILDLEFVTQLGIKPSVIIRVNGKEFCHSGITIIDSTKIMEKEPLDEDYVIINEKEIAVNINTDSDIIIAENLL